MEYQSILLVQNNKLIEIEIKTKSKIKSKTKLIYRVFPRLTVSPVNGRFLRSCA